MYWSDLPRNPSRRMLTQFGALLTLAAAAAAAWRLWHGEPWALAAGVAAISLLLTLARPETLRWIFVVWMVLAFPIGWVLGRVLLAVAFFGLFLPVGLVLRAVGRDPLRRRRVGHSTYWEPRGARDASSYFRQY